MLDINYTQVILIDPQTSLLNIVQNSTLLTSRIIYYIKAFKILNIPIIVTRQNPDRLGELNKCIKEELLTVNNNQNYKISQFDKTCFSCFNEKQFTKKLSSSRNQLLIMGIETAVCIMQSVVQACEMGYNVTILADAIGGRKNLDSKLAIKRMTASGATFLAFDSVIYEIIKDSKSLYFKKILPLVKSFPKG